MMKIQKKGMAYLLAAAMVVTSVPAAHLQASGAAKLSSKKITVKVGNSKVITLKNNKNKTKWKILSGGKCIKLKDKKKNSVRIVAVKKGAARVQVKAGKKKYICRVSVINKNTAASAQKQTKTPEPAKTAETIKTPQPIRTLQPIRTPEAVRTQQPVKTPVISAVPSVTDTRIPENQNTSAPDAANTPAVTDIPKTTGTPSVPAVSEDPGVDKDQKDVAALQKIIQDQKQKGANISEDLDSGEYQWKDGRLTKIYWTWKQLQGELKLSGLSALEYFYCAENQLSALDVSENTALTDLDCRTNTLDSLDVSKNAALKNLHCSNNQLGSLDVSNNNQLEILDCQGNQLADLTIGENTSLKVLGCNDNQLSALDVSKDTSLEVLNCSYNQLDSLDVSRNTELKNLFCGSNRLTGIDVSSNTKLLALSCGFN